MTTMGNRRPTRLVVAAIAAGLLAASCGADGTGGDTAGTATTSGPLGPTTTIGTTTTTTGTAASEPSDPLGAATTEPGEALQQLSLTLVDETRPTDAGASTAAVDTRTLVTEVYVPTGRGPFPLIVFGHGLSGHPDDFTRLLTAWAEAGYLVAAPAFPLTNTGVADSGANLADVRNQPADVSFVIDEMLAAGDGDGPLGGLVDPGHIGVAGLSLGGITTYAVTFSECCRDDRVDAAVVLAGTASTSDGFGAFDPSGDVPVLVMHGDADAVIGHPAAVESYALLDPPKYLVTLLGGGHAEPFADQSTAFAPVVDTVTVEFWDAYLDGDPAAVADLRAAAAVDGLTTLEYAD